MLIFVKIVFIVFLLAINTYGFLLVKRHSEDETDSPCKSGAGKFLICALLGGALAIYVAMFIYKFRLDSLVMMVFVPVLIAVNVFFAFILFRTNFGFVVKPSNSIYALKNLVFDFKLINN